MTRNWKKISVSWTLAIFAFMPDSLFRLLVNIGGYLLDRKKGQIARRAMKTGLDQAQTNQFDQHARQAAANLISYGLILPRLQKCRYQLHNFDQVEAALAREKGLIITTLHMGPPELGTLALHRKGVSVSTVIGEGKKNRWLNTLGQYGLMKLGIPFIKRGNPLAFIKTLRQKTAIILHIDMRSREAPVNFLGQETQAPSSAIRTALMMDTPLLFHYCTGSSDQLWHLHFEPFDLLKTSDREKDVHVNLQRLFTRMEAVINRHPQLWIWHYDRFKLKGRV